jgi:predicted TIM-barrel fold metal-dependent hydrolase
MAMAGLGYPIYDADNHLYEKEDCFTRHLDPKLAREAIAWVEIKGRKKLAICGKITNYIPNPTFDMVATPGSLVPWHRGINPGGRSIKDIFQAGALEPCRPEFKDRDTRLRVMDDQGLHAALIHGTLVNAIEHRMKERADLLHATLHAYNQWMEEDWGFAHQERIYGVPMLSLVDVDRACVELEWCLVRGARAVAIRPAPVYGHPTSRSPGKPEFDAFWARVNEAGIFAVLHVTDSGYGDHAADWDAGSELTPFAPSPFRQMIVRERPIYDAVANLIVDGLFWRHPRLRVASIENGSEWVPALLRKLDKVYRQMPDAFHEDPRETFRRHVWVVPEYGEDMRWLADAIGVEHVLFGSDFPHAEGYAAPLEWVEELDKFDADETRRIMSSNLAALLRSPVGPRL